jgi:hypothetical protein
MPEERWRPLSMRESGRTDEWDAPVEGVPPWLMQGLMEWLRARLSDEDEGTLFGQPIQFIEQRLRVPLDWSIGVRSAFESLKRRCEDQRFFLDLLDFMLWLIDGEEEASRNLRGILGAGGSAWTVAPDGRGLSRRVQPEASEAARQIVTTGSRAGVLLGQAWRHVYGPNPNPSAGYREAVRAVEAAACHVVLPNAERATLGTVITALREAPSGKYATVFPESAVRGNPLEVVRGLMELVWTSQLDRHGTADDTVPLSVSQQQAEAALHAAVTLVQWLQRGFIRLATPSGASE